jgi:hypothetical protein
MTKSLIVFKNIDELDSVHSKLESMKSLLIVFALILCMAKVAKFFASFFVMKKIKLVQDEPVRKRKNVSRIVRECDKPVSKRRATLVPTNKPLEVVHDTPTSRRNSNVKTTVDDSDYNSFCHEKREYVKNWKEERIKRQLFEMLQMVRKSGLTRQKLWINCLK